MSSNSSETREDQLLGAMMKYLMHGTTAVSFLQLSKDLGFMERTKTWRNSWKVLVEEKQFLEAAEGSTAVYSGDYVLTQAGKDHASTPEYQEYLKDLAFQPASNEDHQERLKKLMKKPLAKVIFDLLLKYGPLSRKELATIIGLNDRGHGFNYGLKELVVKEIVEETGDKKKQLANTAFLNPDDRPEPEELDPDILEQGAAKIESRKQKRSGGSGDGETDGSPKKRKKTTKKKSGKKQGANKEEDDSLAEDESSVTKESEDSVADSGSDGEIDEPATKTKKTTKKKGKTNKRAKRVKKEVEASLEEGEISESDKPIMEGGEGMTPESDGGEPKLEEEEAYEKPTEEQSLDLLEEMKGDLIDI